MSGGSIESGNEKIMKQQGKMYKKWMVLKKWVDLCETSVDLLPGTKGG